MRTDRRLTGVAYAASASFVAAAFVALIAPAIAQSEPSHGAYAEPTTIDLAPMAPHPRIGDDGTLSLPALEVPYSAFASPGSRDDFVRRSRQMAAMAPMQGAQAQSVPPMDMLALRQLLAPMLAAQVTSIQQRFPYQSERSTLNGVSVEIFTPATGISRQNRNRVLINVHGGGYFLNGGGPGGVVESAPIAHFGNIKVVAVDYRQAPEASFPAASQDLAAVYRALLRDYRPENIGIYGCSSGGFITAESVAWFRHENLPLPGALGVFCASLFLESAGDSAYIAPYFDGGVTPRGETTELMRAPYFGGVRRDDPLASPAASEETLRAFPPTLFLTGSRAPEASAAAHSNVLLRSLGVDSEFLLFDGYGHGFYTQGADESSQTALRLIVQFFDEHLGQRRERRAR